MKITRFGHAAVLVEVADKRILLDPGGFSPDETFELDGLDLIVVTHQHPDHVDLDRVPRLLERNTDARLVAEPGIASKLRESGADWSASGPGDTIEVGAATLTGLGGKHAVIHPDLPRVGNVGMVITADGEPTLFHPGDTYEYTPSDIDVLALPLSAPWAKLSETVDFVRAIAPGVLFPIHDCTIAEAAYGIYWGQVGNLGGEVDARLLGQRESTTVTR